MTMYKIIFILIGTLTLFSCEKKDTPITLPPKGNGSMLQTDLGDNFEKQYFINLQNSNIVHISNSKNWDLAFSCKPNDHGVFLNGGKLMSVYNTGKKYFSAIRLEDTIGNASHWKYDYVNGMIDSSAIGDWKKDSNIYLIKLNNQDGKVKKIKFVSEDIFEYTIQVGDIVATTPITITIPKMTTKNYTYFSFDLMSIIEDVEPSKTSWDMVLTVYNHTFYEQNPPLPYIVTGVLLNPNGTSAYKDSLTGYLNIDASFATSVPLSQERNVIGFDWKKYNIDENLYTIDNRYSYIIKNRMGSIFKLRFLDYYGATGKRGTPKFEFEQLK